MQDLIQEAYTALMAKEYTKALELYNALANDNEPTSYYYLGFLHFHGHAVIQTHKKPMNTTSNLPREKYLSRNLK